jgi:hypothetical protein
MFFNDHAPPHFHARYGEFEATIEIGTLAIIEGQLPRVALNLVQEWAMIQREELLEDWRLCRGNTPPTKIEPLAGHVQLRREDLTGALAPLADVQFFEQVLIDSGAVAWPGEIDLAPDAMYAQVANQRNGERQAEPVESQR